LKLLITFAVEAEFAPWKRRFDFRVISRGGETLYRTQIGTAEADFAVTGMGLENSARRAATLMSESYDICIASGFAGALKPDYVVGDVVAARSVVEIRSSRSVASDSSLVSIAANCGAKIVGTFGSLDHVAYTPEEKSRLAPLADVCDMESFAVLSAAESRSIPAIAIRAISDSVRDEVPAGVDSLVDGAGRLNVRGVVKFAARHPLSMPAMIRLGQNSKTAAESLARFLESFIGKLASSPRARLSEELQGAVSR